MLSSTYMATKTIPFSYSFQNKYLDEKMNEKLSYITDIQLDSSNGVQKTSMMRNHHADVVVYIRLIQISIEICDHQSSTWLNNSVNLPPFSNDLDKNCP